MVINYCGEGCFKIQSGKLSIVVDPLPRFKGEIVLRTKFPISPPKIGEARPEALRGGNFPASSAGRQFPNTEISSAGEYEVQGVEVRGFQLSASAKASTDKAKESDAKTVKTIYSVKAEELNLAFLGEISEALDPGFLEKLGTVDILFIPASAPQSGASAGEARLINPEAAAKLIKQIGPKIVIGSHIKKPDDAKKFFKELEQKPDLQEKLVVKKKDLPAAMRAMMLQA